MLGALISYSGSSITLTLKRFAQQYTSGFQLLATVYNYITDCQDFLVNDTDHWPPPNLKDPAAWMSRMTYKQSINFYTAIIWSSQ